MEVLALVLILYFLLGACVCLLVCVNPNDPGILGKLNRLVLGSLPQKIGNAIRRICGDRVYNCFGNAKHYLLETNHPIVQIFYLLISPGGYIAFVTKGMLVFMPNRVVGIGMLVVANLLAYVCFYVYYKVCSVSPGKLSTDNKEYNVKKHKEYYDNIMYTKDKECMTCKLTKPARSKHCRVCNMCVLKFDHHCIWIRQCVGQKNYKWFVLFLGLHSILCLYYSFIGFLSIFDFVMENRLLEMKFRMGNQLIDSNFLIVLQYIFMNHTTFVFLIFMCAIMGIALALFVFYHFYLISQNLTTNERIKANDFIAQLKDEIKAKNKIVKEAGGEDKLPQTIEHGKFQIPRARFVENLRQDEKELKYLQSGLINKGFIHNLKVVFNE